MWEREFRFGLGSVMTVVLWVGASGLVVWSAVTSSDGMRGIAIMVGAAAVAMTVVRDNVKTRRVVRSLVREGLAPVRDFGRRD